MSDDERDILKAHLQVRYDGEVRWIDQQLRDGWPILDDRGVLDDTLVVFWTDHGEAFWEHGAQTHAHWLFGEETDGLLFFWAKNIVPNTWNEPTHAIDMVPTILDALEVPIPAELPGEPVGAAPIDRVLFNSTYTRQGVLQSATQRDHTLHYRWSDGELRLYDRSVDPGETDDLLLEQPDHYMRDRLWEAMEPRTEAIDPLIEAWTPIPP